MKDLKKIIVRKIIPLIAILGCCGGVAAAVLESTGASDSYLITGLYILVYALAGTAAGFFLVIFFENKGQNIVKRNVKDELLLVQQPIYFVAAVPLVFAYLTNMGAGVGAGVFAAIFYASAFLLGLSNGIFDYRESVTKNLLFAAVVPIGISFVYGYYVNRSDAAANMAWLYGSIYLFSYLLFLNRMQLNSIIFFRKSVNVEDSKRIRKFNDLLIAGLYIVYLVLFNLRKMLNTSYDILLIIFKWIFTIMEKITDWLIADIKMEAVEEIVEKERLELLGEVKRPWLEILLKIMMYVVVAAVAVAAVISIVIIIIKTIKKIRDKLQSNYNHSLVERKIESKEYEEESKIVRDLENKDRIKFKKRKMQYNLKKLKDIPLAGDKIRYVYGFVLERLYNRKVNIEQSDTPGEILKKVKSHRNGEELAKMGFEEFTEKYREARYSGKEIEIDGNIARIGEKFEKGISSIQAKKTKSRFE